MKFFNQSDLFWLLVTAARNPALVPDPSILQQYRESRRRAAIRALRSKNVFLYTEGARTSTNLNDVTTIYTQPAGARMIVVGYSDNLRYGSTIQIEGGPNIFGPLEVIFPQMHRVRVIGGVPRALSLDLMPAQAGVSGQPRYTSTNLPAPFIIEPNEQIAIDLAYDTAMVEPEDIPYQAFTFFCLKISDRLTPEDEAEAAIIDAYIASHNYQRGIFLNCVSSTRNDVAFDTATAGGMAVCETRPANGPLMIRGIGTTLQCSTLLITDMYDGHSFSLNRAMRSSSLNFADNADSAPGPGSVPCGAPIWTFYFEFPSPHLLRAGVTLKCEAVNGGIDATGLPQLDNQTGNVILFQGNTV